MANEVIENRRFAIRVALFYAALFVFYGTHVPFTPIWLDWAGLSANQISIVMALPLFLRAFVTPLVAVAADRTHSHRYYVGIFAVLSLVFALALASVRAFWPVLLLAVPMIVASSTIVPLIETIAVQGMRARGLDYGRMRLWGSLSFVAASFLGGIVVSWFGAGAGIWLVVTGCALTVVASGFLPPETRKTTPTETFSILKIEELSELFAHREVILFLLAAGLVQAAHATFLVFGVLLWQKQGYSATWSGMLWAVGVFAEVLVFARSGRIAMIFGAPQLLAIASALSIVRWTVLAFEPPLAVLLPLQLLHGVTYGASHIAAMHFIHDAIPRDKAGSAQALYATVAAGVAMGCTTLIAGYVYARAGSASYYAMAAIAAVSLLASLRLMRVWHGRVLVPATAA